MSKRKTAEPVVISDPSNAVEIVPLGAGSEVGRSCIILKYQGKSIMLDCGVHPAYSGMSSLPIFDYEDLSTIDVALITHFHLDHCAAVPFLLGRTSFKGRIFMTHPTKAIYHSLLKDFARMQKGSTDDALFDEAMLDASMERIEVIDFYQTIEVSDILITAYRAGHVLGAAMFMVDILGMRCLYTGDYSRVPDRHLPAADLPPVQPHIVIIESTYGVSRHQPRDQREHDFVTKVHDTLRRGGRVLLPVVALGRAQELLLLLDEYWSRHPELAGCPIYQASAMMAKSMSVYQTYVESLGEDIRRVFHDHNPFLFRHVQHRKQMQHFDDVGPCVLMATPSGLQSGVSRDIFEAWCDNPANSTIICDFAVQGTLAREILGGPSTILTKTGVRKPLRCAVHHISFSAHADYDQTSGFLDSVRPPNVVLVHGEATEMARLRAALERGAAAQGFARSVFTPKNMQAVQIEHQPLRCATLVGGLVGDKPPRPGDTVRGLLVSRSLLRNSLMAADDLPAYSKLYRGKVTQRQAVAINSKPWSELRLALEVMFEGVEGAGILPVTSSPPRPPTASTIAPPPGGSRQATPEPGAAAEAGDAAERPAGSGADGEAAGSSGAGEKEQAVTVGDYVRVTYRPGGGPLGAARDPHVVVEWEGGKAGDMVADAVVAVLLQAAGEPPGAEAAERSRKRALLMGDQQAAAAAELQLTAELLRAQFGPASVDEAQSCISLQVDGKAVVVEVDTKEGGVGVGGSKVRCDDDALRARVSQALYRLGEALRPCPASNLDL